MSSSPFVRGGNRFLAWCGLLTGVFVALPALLRAEDEGWSGPNVLFLAVGMVLFLVWAIRLVFLYRGKQRRRPIDTDERKNQ